MELSLLLFLQLPLHLLTNQLFLANLLLLFLSNLLAESGLVSLAFELRLLTKFCLPVEFLLLNKSLLCLFLSQLGFVSGSYLVFHFVALFCFQSKPFLLFSCLQQLLSLLLFELLLACFLLFFKLLFLDSCLFLLLLHFLDITCFFYAGQHSRHGKASSRPRSGS